MECNLIFKTDFCDKKNTEQTLNTSVFGAEVSMCIKNSHCLSVHLYYSFTMHSSLTL